MLKLLLQRIVCIGCKHCKMQQVLAGGSGWLYGQAAPFSTDSRCQHKVLGLPTRTIGLLTATCELAVGTSTCFPVHLCRNLKQVAGHPERAGYFPENRATWLGALLSTLSRPPGRWQRHQSQSWKAASIMAIDAIFMSELRKA